MSFEDNFQIGDLLEQGVNVGIAPLPVESAGEPAFVPSWTDAWSTFVTSEHPEQALDFITFMAKEGNMLREAGGAFPLDQQVAKDADYAADSPAKQQMLDVMGLTNPIPFVPGWFTVFGQLEDTFPQIVENGDAAAALHDVAADHPGRPGARMGDVGQPEVTDPGTTPSDEAGQPSTLGGWFGRRPLVRPPDDGRGTAGRPSCSCPRGSSGWCSFIGLPVVLMTVVSLTDWSLTSTPRFVGLDNYARMLADHRFSQSVSVTLRYVVLAVPLFMLTGLGLALLLNAKLPGIGVFRTILFVPSILAGVAVAVLWLQILSPETGVLNQVLRSLGVDDPPRWLSSPDWAVPAVVLTGIWAIGGGAIIYLAGLQNIPPHLYEAAELDGAGPGRPVPPRHPPDALAHAVLRLHHDADRRLPGVRRRLRPGRQPRWRRRVCSSTSSTCGTRGSGTAGTGTPRRSRWCSWRSRRSWSSSPSGSSEKLVYYENDERGERG